MNNNNHPFFNNLLLLFLILSNIFCGIYVSANPNGRLRFRAKSQWALVFCNICDNILLVGRNYNNPDRFLDTVF